MTTLFIFSAACLLIAIGVSAGSVSITGFGIAMIIGVLS